MTWVGAARVMLHLQMEDNEVDVCSHQQVFSSSSFSSVFFPAGSSPHLTGCAMEALRAFTHKHFQEGVTAAAVPARTAGAAVSLNLTVSTHEPHRADTLVASGRILERKGEVTKNPDTGHQSALFVFLTK